MFRITALAAALVAAIGWATPSTAQTISYSEAITGFANACGADIQKHCATVPLNEGKLFGCLRAKEASLSGGCKTAAVAIVASLDRRAAAQDSALQLCAGDIRRLCKEYDPGNGRYLRCLQKFESQVSAPCNQAITDAGWR